MNDLLFIEKLRPDHLSFPAYFVASTAPINIEDQGGGDTKDVNVKPDSKSLIEEISQHLQEHKGDAEILVVIHGYNTSKTGVREWFERIYKHLDTHYCSTRSKGLILIGYRWPSEQISPKPAESQEEGGSFEKKRKSSKDALPVILGKVFRWSTLGLIGGISGSVATIVAIALQASNAVIFLIICSTVTLLSLVALSPIFTLIALRLSGYFRDNYRANNFGVSDLVELIRHIDNAVIGDKSSWEGKRIKLSFIGHSMGGFVVTNAVRILSDVFDSSSIGASKDAINPEKKPSSFIGNVFSLGRLVLVSPDIPADTIISGRANFLSSSLRRFEEAYLFSNEGDMALRLASTAANYFSYPSKTQDGGYRLGNVAVRIPTEGVDQPSRKKVLQRSVKQMKSYGIIARLPNEQLVSLKEGKEGQECPISKEKSYPLDYLFIREKQLSARQKVIALHPVEPPMGEKFTFFDCTDYTEEYQVSKGQKKKVGLLSHALRKQTLTFGDYVSLTIDYFSGKIDTHGGYFSSAKEGLPDADFTKLAIYGLACIGFEKFLIELKNEPYFGDYKSSFDQILKGLASKPTTLTPYQQEKVALSQILSSICRDKGIQVLLAQERYTKDVLEELEQKAEENL